MQTYGFTFQEKKNIFSEGNDIGVINVLYMVEMFPGKYKYKYA